LIGQTVSIHNGKEFKNVTVTREKVGFKFGEFSPTRRYNIKKKPSKK
jgi:small subunit ribosomal protein S19